MLYSIKMFVSLLLFSRVLKRRRRTEFRCKVEAVRKHSEYNTECEPLPGSTRPSPPGRPKVQIAHNKRRSTPTKPNAKQSFFSPLDVLSLTVSFLLISLLRTFLLITMGKYLTGKTELGRKEGSREGGKAGKKGKGEDSFMEYHPPERFHHKSPETNTLHYDVLSLARRGPRDSALPAFRKEFYINQGFPGPILRDRHLLKVRNYQMTCWRPAG